MACFVASAADVVKCACERNKGDGVFLSGETTAQIVDSRCNENEHCGVHTYGVSVAMTDSSCCRNGFFGINQHRGRLTQSGCTLADNKKAPTKLLSE